MVVSLTVFIYLSIPFGIYTVNHTNYKDFGRTEDKSFERLLSSIADWFVEHPDNDWQHQLQVAASTQYQQMYTY